ncbi:SICA-like antigen [Plasmodium coatneyi]|uniref:SICA-like antigen n=1 Tax=Plasmodium coatneyi TaxID=208452 RepID=A0A1B1DSM9_9APIC|nr:SICA-like antigen [Plasmodium coatneyi]ANQ05791.1 SICA-like antigen [Plasmodium coatneyi]
MGEFQYFKEFMEEWLRKEGESKRNANVLLKRIKEGMRDILENIYQDAEEEKQHCNIHGDDGSPKLKDDASKALCKILIRIFYWIGGLRQVGDKGKGWIWGRTVLTIPAEKKLQDYLRCIVGKIVIVRMFGTHCRLNEVTPIVKQAIGENVEKKGIQDEHEKCENIDFKSLSIGGKIFWEEIEKSIEQDEEKGKTITEIIEQGKCEGKNVTERTEDSNTKGKWKSTAELLGLNDEDELKALIADSDNWSKGGLDRILCYIRDEGGIEKVKEILAQTHAEFGKNYKGSLRGGKDIQEDRCATYLTRGETNEKDSSPPSTSSHSPARPTTPTESGSKGTKAVKEATFTEADGSTPAALPGAESPDKSVDSSSSISSSSTSRSTQVDGAAGSQDGGNAGHVDSTKIDSRSNNGNTAPTQNNVDNIQLKPPSSHESQTPQLPPTTPPEEVIHSRTSSTVPQTIKPLEEWNIWNVRDVLTPYFPFIPVAIGTVVMGYLLSKYFGYFGKTKQRYKRMTQISGSPLGKNSEGTGLTISYAPYEYRLMKEKRQPIHSTEMQQEEHANRKTIIDIHLESLNEYQNQNEDPELTNNVDFLQIIVEELMKFEFMNKGNIKRGTKEHNLSSSENEHPSLTCNVPYWINWIQRNKVALVEIKTQPWFYDLKVSWKEHQRVHADRSELNDDNNYSFEEKRKDSFRSWVREQRALMELNSQTADWFKHLLDNIEEVNGTDELKQQQLCKDSYKAKNRLAPKLWMLILALVFEECEREENIVDKEFYFDHLLQNV